jgi:hypothetical protein
LGQARFISYDNKKHDFPYYKNLIKPHPLSKSLHIITMKMKGKPEKRGEMFANRVPNKGHIFRI